MQGKKKWSKQETEDRAKFVELFGLVRKRFACFFLQQLSHGDHTQEIQRLIEKNSDVRDVKTEVMSIMWVLCVDHATIQVDEKMQDRLKTRSIRTNSVCFCTGAHEVDDTLLYILNNAFLPPAQKQREERDRKKKFLFPCFSLLRVVS